MYTTFSVEVCERTEISILPLARVYVVFILPIIISSFLLLGSLAALRVHRALVLLLLFFIIEAVAVAVVAYLFFHIACCSFRSVILFSKSLHFFSVLLLLFHLAY